MKQLDGAKLRAYTFKFKDYAQNACRPMIAVQDRIIRGLGKSVKSQRPIEPLMYEFIAIGDREAAHVPEQKKVGGKTGVDAASHWFT
jgi:hypothetical protein